MLSDDYFKKQIDQLGKALGKVLAQLLNLPTGKSELAFEEINAALQEHVDADINKLLQIPNADLVSVLWHTHNFRTQNLEDFAFLLLTLGTRFFIEQSDPKERDNALRKALVIYNYLQENSPVYSLERQQKISELQHLLT